MSWDKNTLIITEVDSTIETLKSFNTPYKLTILGEIRGRGLNDDGEASYPYLIRRLEYKDTVILEQMISATDCDTDDVLMSYRFDKKDEPKNWKIEEEIKNS